MVPIGGYHMGSIIASVVVRYMNSVVLNSVVTVFSNGHAPTDVAAPFISLIGHDKTPAPVDRLGPRQVSAPFTGIIVAIRLYANEHDTDGVDYNLVNADYYVDFGVNKMWIIRLLPGVLVINSGGETVNICINVDTRASIGARRPKHIDTHNNILLTR
jgi:hypothetical protein